MATAFIAPTAAVERLKALQDEYWRCDAREAISRLYGLLGKTEILQLYEANFPVQYRKSKASRKADTPNGYSPLEKEFFALVDKHLFPIGDIWFDEDERIDWIPLEALGLDTEGIENWKISWQVVYALASSCYAEVNWNEVADFLPDGAELPAPVYRREQYAVDWKRFERKVRRADPHLKHLDAMLAMGAFDTGCDLLDTPPDVMGNSEMPEWSQENIDWLAKDWQKGKAIIERAHAVGDWLNADPQRLADLIRLWNTCIVFEQTADADTAEEEG